MSEDTTNNTAMRGTPYSLAGNIPNRYDAEYRARDAALRARYYPPEPEAEAANYTDPDAEYVAPEICFTLPAESTTDHHVDSYTGIDPDPAECGYMADAPWRDAVPAEDPEPPEYDPCDELARCPACGAANAPLGQLGSALCYRCRDCGLDYQGDPDPDEGFEVCDKHGRQAVTEYTRSPGYAGNLYITTLACGCQTVDASYDVPEM